MLQNGKFLVSKFNETRKSKSVVINLNTNRYLFVLKSHQQWCLILSNLSAIFNPFMYRVPVHHLIYIYTFEKNQLSDINLQERGWYVHVPGPHLEANFKKGAI